MEDKGIDKTAAGHKITHADISSISDAELLANFKGDEMELKQNLILSFSCKDLPNMDKDSKSDTFVVLWFLRGKGKDETRNKIG